MVQTSEEIKINQVTSDYQFHLQWMYDSVIRLNAKHVLETGTDVGDSARIFLAALEKTGGQLTTIDNKVCDQGWATGNPNIKFITGDTQTFIWNTPIDILFLDDHVAGTETYSHVLRELDRLGIWVKKGGLIILHDTGHTEFGPGIRMAIRSWCSFRSLKYIEDPRGYGMAMIDINRDLQA